LFGDVEHLRDSARGTKKLFVCWSHFLFFLI
jgi:hypothetical protein